MVKARLYQRDFSEGTPPMEVAMRVRRYANGVHGPQYAEISVTGDRRGLWTLLEWLRAPIVIEDEYGMARWWGFVNEVVLNIGGVMVGATLDDMANSVAVAYSYVEPGTDTVGARLTTAYSVDQDSIDEYGQKDMLVGLSGSTTGLAEKIRDTVLAEKAEPAPTVQITGEEREDSAMLYCRGWWDTLGWRYYENTGTTSTVTTTQISDIITDVGEFVTGVDIEDASGLSTSEYQDGDRTANMIIEELLQADSGGSKPLLAVIGAQRRLRIYQEPARTASYWLNGRGELETAAGAIVPNDECPANFWCDLRMPALDEANAPTVRQVLPFWVEWSEYNADTDRLLVRAKNAPGPWDIAQGLFGRHGQNPGKGWEPPIVYDGGIIAQSIRPFVRQYTSNVVWLDTPLTSTSYDGDDAVSSGDNNIDLTAFGLPENVTAAYVVVRFQFATAGAASLKTSTGYSSAGTYVATTGVGWFLHGWVKLNAGSMTLYFAQNATNVRIQIFGYMV